jgi:hypothetical protein
MQELENISLITEKVRKVPLAQKAAAAGVANKLILFLLLFSEIYTLDYAQILPANETQVNLSGYFDSFDVSVLYPSITMTKRVSESTSITGRYLVDMITAASIKSHNPVPAVDVVTSASNRGGEGPPTFDEVRHEFNVGFAHLLGSSILTGDVIYSTESDYTSATLVGNFTQFLAENNTSIQLGIVRSWDRVFPNTKDWVQDKNVTTLNAAFTQNISTRLILQALGTYTNNNGLLSDNYQLVPITINGQDSLFDPIHPDLRIRRAAAMFLKYRLSDKSSMQLGYRYYWDSWDLTSSTYSASYERYLSKHVILNVGWRGNFQTSAFFFKPIYTAPEEYMTTDIKLDAGYSNQLQLDLILSGGDKQNYLPFMKDDRVQYIINLNFYLRHTNSPYSFNNLYDMFATNINIGIRYRY